MFLIIVLFGLLALGLAFVTYLQSDLNHSTPPEPAPPAIVAPAAIAADAATPELIQMATPDSSGAPSTLGDPSTLPPAAAPATTAPTPLPGPADAAEQLRATLKEATETLSKAAAENKDPGTPPQP